MSVTRKHHAYIQLIAGFDAVFITFGTTGLDDSFDAELMKLSNRIRIGKKPIRGTNCFTNIMPELLCLPYCQ
jgi:hypothetical protein